VYGLIGSFKAQAGKRDELIALMLAGTGGMPGCLSYVVAADPADADVVWVTEVWTDKAAHEGSLQLAQVKEVIAKAMPLIAGMGQHTVTEPRGGVGLPKA
jgi:quinol monooxygenase YgiN